MRPVLTGATLPLAQKLDIVVAIISFGILAAIKPKALTTISIQVEHIFHKEHAHGFGDGNG